MKVIDLMKDIKQVFTKRISRSGMKPTTPTLMLITLSRRRTAVSVRGTKANDIAPTAMPTTATEERVLGRRMSYCSAN